MNWIQTRARKSLPSEILRKQGIKAAPVWPDDIAQDLGVSVTRLQRYPGWRGALRFDANSANLWFYLHDDGPAWDNVFIALELGRLHVGTPGEYTDDDLKIADPQKRGAWIFAQQLLMPLPWIRYYGTAVNQDVERLAEVFGVPIDVMSRRLVALMNEGKI